MKNAARRGMFPSLLILSAVFVPHLMADLGAAKSFVVLSSGGTVVFSNRDNVTKISVAGAATCPAAAGCSIAVGGTIVAVGAGPAAAPDQIRADVLAAGTAAQAISCTGGGLGAICSGGSQISGMCITGGGGVSNPTACAGGADTSGTNSKLTLLGKAGPDAAAFAAFLSGLSPTQSLPAITPGTRGSVTIHVGPGLNIIQVPSISLGNNATLTIDGPAGSFAALNIGNAAAAGGLTLGNGAVVVLSGGITPDHVVFNVQGKGGAVVLGNQSGFNGTILAPFESFVCGNGNTPQPIVINGALLFGQNVLIGNNVDINFYPLVQVARPVKVGIVGTVDISTLPLPSPGQGDADSDPEPPKIEEPPLTLALPLSGSSIAVSTPPPTPLIRRANVARRDTAGPPLIDAIQFNGLAENGTIAPPDTQLAAGNTTLVEMVNNQGALYDKLGRGIIGKPFSLDSLFINSSTNGTDPRVVFDPASDAYYAAWELRTSGGDDIRLGVSTDQGVHWAIYEVAGNTVDTCYDQPKLGFSGNTIMLSWNDYTHASSCTKTPGSSFSGVEYIVIQKAGVVNIDDTVPAVIWGPDSGRFPVVPAVSQSPTSVQYAATKGVGGSNFGVMQFTGVPGISDVNISHDDSYGIGASTAAPAAVQPSGGNASIPSGDDRLLNAVWQDGSIWGSFTESCQTPARACSRIVQVNTGNGSVLNNVTVSGGNADVYYPALTLDINGNLVFALTMSSATLDPTATVVGVPGAVFTPVVFGIAYQPGAQAYSSTNRWGDYSAAVRDPNDPTVVWVAQEWGGVAGTPTVLEASTITEGPPAVAAGTWSTAIAAVFFQAIIIP